MKIIKTSLYILTIIMFIPLFSCLDLTELNQDPNNPEEVSSNYILTYVLTNTAKTYSSMGDWNSNVAGAMQYIQQGTEFQSYRINHYNWDRGSWANFYNLLRNVEIINEDAIKDENLMFEAISLTLRAFLFGTVTDLFGDCPYSESLEADNELYFPKYDEQKDIYKGVLEDLKKADELFANPGINDFLIAPNSDVLYGGDPVKWRKFNNALRLRYCMRLYHKKNEMSDAGINILSEFSDAASFTFTDNSDNAEIKYLGTTWTNSFSGGPLNESNPPFRTKPCATIVNKLKSLNDPRLHRWITPVQYKWDSEVTEMSDKSIANLFGEMYDVKFRPLSAQSNVDTSLYVGLPMGLAAQDALNFNKGDDTGSYHSEMSPYISFLHERFRKNTEEYLKMNLISYSEVEFLLAEASILGDFSISGSTSEHYRNGVVASLNYWGISDGVNGFSFEDYFSNDKVDIDTAPDKQERIIEQKWISLWFNVEAWFDWRRTGYPALEAGPVAEFGPALPVRFMYPEPNQDEKYLVNYDVAVGKLESTIYVPGGQSKDHPYSKIWLIQNTGKPY
ncbi:SusD/RagB family nutrient-binding outer membrane lipoprotein [Mariniphaga sediminis]|uniref:SusD/RagB family nutrient-binding outer membrane lipoprotein n=1 Tax=Mariniphaga sediminis TaxID=1628158 RepID=A0A399D0S8_9BACT|nr:SusD/RagB family nutrient-binding outer membrane lipoprotein [Mariniphaga sediminis]RIH65464.1 SusD/RagB family nutrient-binding outer membrane lipoprotein [Mariniphaga sediminis]